MTNTVDVLPILPSRSALPAPSPRPLTTVALSELERSAVGQLVTGEVDAVSRYVQERATAYASGDADVRRRALSRAAAVQEAHVQQLSSLLAAAVARRDIPAAHLLDKVLTSATTRYRGLLEQLRLEFAPARRVAVMAKGTVAIAVEEKP